MLIVAIFLLLIIVSFSIPWKKKNPPPVVNNNPAVVQRQVFNAATLPKKELTPEESGRASIATVAKNFAEIYGTYSNQSNFQNVESVLPLLSASYRAEMENFLAKARSSYKMATDYKGVTATALNSIVESMDDAKGMATVLVKMQKTEYAGTQANFSTGYQDMRIDLVKQGDIWLVDNYQWVK